MPSIYTKAERLQIKTIRARLAAGNTALEKATAEGNALKMQRARGEISAAKRDRAAIQEKAKARKLEKAANESERHLELVKQQFPVIGTASAVDWGKKLAGESQPEVPQESYSFTADELSRELEKTRARLQSLGSDEKYSAARKHLLERIDALKGMLRELQEEEAEVKRQEKADQDNRDFLAAEDSVKSLREPFEARLAKGYLSPAIRQKTRQTFLELAVKNRERVKEAGNALQEHSEFGMVHPRAVFNARADWYQKAADQLKVFQYDLNNETPIHALEGFDKTFWDSGLVVSASNLNFRGKLEKSLIVHCARKYYEQTGNRVLLERLPDFPDPREYKVPNALVPLERLQQIEIERCLFALEPLHFDSIGEKIYSVPTSSVERPNSKPLLLWGTGAEVKVGVEALYDRKAGGYRRFPTPASLEPNWAIGGQRYEAEQDEYGNWQRVPISNAPRESWSQDAEGNWKPDRSLNGQWVRSALIAVVPGDRKPPASDPRTEFRYGSWFTPEEVQRADKAQLSLRLLTTSSGTRTVADQIAKQRDSEAPLSEEESRNTWRRREKELEELKRKSA